MSTNELAIITMIALIRGAIEETTSTQKYNDFDTRVFSVCKHAEAARVFVALTSNFQELAGKVENAGTLSNFDLFFKGVEETFQKYIGNPNEEEEG